jgi:hypothetical protein
MARGGARPGAGRPRKIAAEPAASKPVRRKPAAKKKAEAPISPLDYMLRVMLDPEADPQRRDRMAMAAAPFLHARPNDSKPGKKEAAAEAAKQVAGGRFGARPRPLKLVGNA